MFTRHFYEQRDVVSALRMAILLGRPKEAAFWCQELIDSQQIQTVWLTLLETWLCFINYTFPLSFVSIKDDPQKLCATLASCKQRNCSTIYILLAQDIAVDRLSKSSYSLEHYLTQALQEKRPRSAWWAASQIDLRIAWKIVYPELYDLLQEIGIDISVTKHLLCASILYVCYMKKETIHSLEEIPAYLQKDLVHWKSLLGRRGRRLHSIPFSLLYGEVSKNPLSCLYTFEKSVQEDHGGFWWNILHTYGWTAEKGWTNDDTLEAFYSDYFPDDIPDEWSLQEQKKSHGVGSTMGGNQRSVSRWMRTWLPLDTLIMAIYGISEKELITRASGLEWSDRHTLFDCLLNTVSLWKPDTMKKQLEGIRRVYTPLE